MVKKLEYAKKLVYLSNKWYNDGLKKANIRDLSGAVNSLRKSLTYNRSNLAARNLLGLVYYGRGEVAEALVEWIISKNMKSHGNIAGYYIKKVQDASGELETINQAVQKYNQCLIYCQQNGEDLAAIQLRKVITAHPTFLKAHQLLALIYIQTEQYAKAKQVLRKALQLDTTNETTLRYMQELKTLHRDKGVPMKTEKAQTVSYNLGNETIIQPVSSTLKDNAALMTFLNIAIGIVVGAAVVGMLAVPTMRRKMNAKTNKEIIVYSEQIAALQSELDLQGKELKKYQDASEATEAEKAVAQGTKGTYDALVTAVEHYHSSEYSQSKLADELLAINPESLGEVGKATYEKMTKNIYPKECETVYNTMTECLQAAYYKRAGENGERILAMDEKYKDGEVLLKLVEVYMKQNDTEKATAKYNRIKELYPDSELVKKAEEAMKPKTEPTTE